MTQMLLFDTCFRLLAAGQLMLIALVIGRSAAPRPIRFNTVMLLLCVAAYLADVAPVIDMTRARIWPLVQLASQATPLFLWTFAHCIFERKIDRRVLVAAAVITLLCWAAIVHAVYVTRIPPVAAGIAQHLLAFLLAAHAIVIALTQWGDDLMQKRRLFRGGFVIVVGLQTLGIVVAESIIGFTANADALLMLQSSTTLIAVMAFGAVLMSGNTALLFDAATAPPPALSPSEHVLKQKLDAAMAANVYREPGLGIGTLAERLDTPEHRLRALINQRLGYRNFSAFLNAHRIADARAWLSDPAKVDLPVLTIAMDLGYGSLAPFNRAFREATGQTPTDYRRAAIVVPENP
jgi:AraC-like DNA-binding protein